jgi:hypothetical protein
MTCREQAAAIPSSPAASLPSCHQQAAKRLAFRALASGNPRIFDLPRWPKVVKTLGELLERLQQLGEAGRPDAGEAEARLLA